MPVYCTDGVIPDETLIEWRAALLDVRVQLSCAVVRAVLSGPCLSRAIALLDLSEPQLCKLFPTRNARKRAVRLRSFALRLSGPRARSMLAYVSWHQLRAAARHSTEDAQIRAAFAQAVSRLTSPPRRRRSLNA